MLPSLDANGRMALGSRPVFPGWAGTLAETSAISLAKIDLETAPNEIIFSRRARAK